MASDRLHELTDLYISITAALKRQPGMSIEEMRRLFSHWGDVTAEPGGIDYIETNAGGVPALWAIPKGCAGDRVLLCAHGGGYVVGSMYTHRKLYGHLAKAVGCRAIIPDYRRAPEHIHPAAVTDMVTVYRWLLEENALSASCIAFAGDSAGGALALTTVAGAMLAGLPPPAATMPMSPWAGWDTSGDTYTENAAKDTILSRKTTDALGALFVGADNDPKQPLANLLYTDYRGFPPIYIQVGDAEAILDDSRRIAKRAREAGADVKLDIFEGMQHVFQFLAGAAPEADSAIRKLASWVKPKLGLN